jgi:hypothetical protein
MRALDLGQDMRPIIISILIVIFSTGPVLADSMSITLKPTKGLSGTASLNLHEDGSVTILEYESPTKISESSVNINSSEKDEIRSLTLRALKTYLNQNSHSHIKEYTFTFSIAYTDEGVTKSISTKRINEEAMKVVKLLIGHISNKEIKAIEKQI